MTQLVGNSSIGAFTGATSVNGNTGARANAMLYTATNSGNAVKLWFYANDRAESENIKLFITNSTGTLLAVSSPVSYNAGSGAGWKSATISSTAITSSQQYYIGAYQSSADGRLGVMASALGNYTDSSSGTYASPPSSFTFGADGGNANMAFYAEDAGSGTAYTLTADAGAFALTGVATARLLSMASPVGTFALVGANSTSGYGMNAALGTFAMTGIAATLTYTPTSGAVAYTLTAALGTFALAGQSAAQGLKFVSATGAFVLAGQAANLSWSGEVLTVNTNWRSLLGFTVSYSDSRLASIFVDDNTPVPATAVFMGALAYTPGGRVYVCNYPTGGTAPQGVARIAGRSFRTDGAMIIRSSGGTLVAQIGGLNYTTLGELMTNTTAPVRFPNGVGSSEIGVASLSHVS